MIKLLTRRLSLAMFAGLALIGVVAAVATAAGGSLNSGATKGVPRAVPATVAGMPPTSQVLFAVVNSNGTRARGFGSTASVRDATGVYRVTFRQNISGCAFTGTLGLSGNVGVEQSGEIQVVRANVSTSQVFVTTRDSAGNLADRGFHLIVAC